MNHQLWSDSAKQYAESAPKISFYKDTAKYIAEIVDKYEYHNFVDLGCGSANLVLNALLEGYPRRSVTCTDAAKGMIAVAEHNNKFNNATFLSTAAENINFAPDSICCFLANSAFWMFNFEKALSRIHSQLKHNGGLLINFSEWDLQGSKYETLKYSLIDSQLEKSGYAKKEYKGTPIKYSKNTLLAMIESAGFEVSKVITKTICVTKQDWIEFYKVPAIAAKSLPHLDLSEALSTLNLAMNALPQDYTHQMKWLFIKAVKI
ncbi:class I SAM-dependent methyltransferase [Pseudoalteromonas sp. SMS1]|uniref:class I SAM-dependent methyltransferase n=1 Tax=Pseudoalteromonas sp. SMS1 TaxID=2908894 RepID=UPI001F3E8B2E|nr:class I SAM-dependent methyltransferase [Pseudoalteromonas sp. SMS1]MCF2858381.1 class I SAM-dependent methyltransferase [Pseudoalteromonas sp. SMS1]